MDLDRFISQRQGSWRRLEVALQQVERSGIDTLTVDRLRELGALYRQSCSDLIYARTVLQNDELGDFLNKLVGEAYAAIYRKSWLSFQSVRLWLLRDLPATVRRQWIAVAAAWIMLIGGTAAGFVATWRDREAFYYIVPTPYHQLYGNRANDLRTERFGEMNISRSRDFAAMLFTHNIKVALTGFALGAGGGALTSVLLVYNGAMLGSIAANFHRFGQDLDFWALIVPHAGLELSSIALAGAGGLLLGWALIRPGRRSRGEAFAAAGREAVSLALGAAPFLVVAGFIEAFVTPSGAIGPWGKISLGVLTGAAMWLFLCWPRRANA